MDPTCPCKQPLTEHPQWCSPVHCRPTDVDVLHRSDVFTVALCCFDFEAQLLRSDEYTFDRPNETELELTITVTEVDDSTTTIQGVIRLDEIAQITELLTEMRLRDELLSTPVVRDSRAAA
jgi:hypothetical protein